MLNTHQLRLKWLFKMSNESNFNFTVTDSSIGSMQNIIIVPEYINSIILAPVIYVFYQGND